MITMKLFNAGSAKYWRTLSIGLLACSPLLQAAPEKLDGIAAIVNDGVVLESQLKDRVAIVTEQLQSRNQRVPPKSILDSQVIDRLILDNLLLQIAEQQGIKVSDRQLNESIASIAARNGMDLAQFRNALIAEGRDYVSAREQIRKELLISQVQQSNVSRRIKISDQEVQHFLKTDSAGLNQPELLLSFILISIPEQASPEQIQAAESNASQLHQELMFFLFLLP